MNKNKTVAGAIVLIGIVTAGFVLYESPEDCFVREMENWAQEKELTEEVQGILLSDSRKSVVKAKVIIETYDISDLEESWRNIYLETKTLMDYCGIK